MTGCITDCDCAPGEYCEGESGSCAPQYCELEYLGSLVDRVPDIYGQSPTVTINSTATLQCSVQGQVFKTTPTRVTSKLKVLLKNVSRVFGTTQRSF